MVKDVNTPVLVGWAGAAPIGASIAGAAARPLLFIMRSNLENSSSIRETRCSFFKLVQETFRSSALPSLFPQYEVLLQNTRTSRSPNSRKSLVPSFSVIGNLELNRTHAGVLCFRWGRCRLGRCTHRWIIHTTRYLS